MEIKKNDILTVEITDTGIEGEGIGKTDGFILFVKDAVIGDTVQVKVMKAKKNYAYAKLEKVLVPSPFRVQSPCPFHRQCGGCQLQPLSYEKQLEFKQNKIRNNLIRIGGFSPEHIDACMEPIIGMEDPWHYRNKAQFPFGYDKEGNVVTGFYAGRTHNIIANTDCALGVEENKMVLETILAYMKKYGVSAYDETSGKGLIRHVLIRKGFASGQLMACIVINGNKLPEEKTLAEELWKIPGMTSVSINVNTERTNVILGKKVRVLKGEEKIEDTIGDVVFRISPLSFYQVNPVQTKKLYGQALEYAGLTGEETVWDLYCGIGTISLFLAKKAKKVYGVEIVPEAIADAKENAARNGITNAEFYVGKAEEVLPQKYEEDGVYADVIVVDPPRKGCDEKCLETMVRIQPERIVYVSCDSATLARDLKYLGERGYEVRKWRGCDMFPGTIHVETVVLLSKLKVDHHIEIELKMDELDLTAAESKATYDEIKAYVLNKYGLKVSQLYIAQIKRKCGIIERKNYNVSKKEDAKVPQCPPEKEAAIMDALKHFQMI